MKREKRNLRRIGPMRFPIEPRDVPPEIAAERLGKTLEDFNSILANLLERGFPRADPDSGNFDLVAIDRWCDARHSHLFDGNSAMQARDASTVVPERIARMKAGPMRG
jgi:hypothetical protein